MSLIVVFGKKKKEYIPLLFIRKGRVSRDDIRWLDRVGNLFKAWWYLMDSLQMVNGL